MTSTTANGTSTAPGGERAIAVVGGGWCGIAMTWSLRERGCETVLIDEAERLGGRSAPGPVLGGREITFGGKNIGRRYDRFRAFASAMGDPEYEPFGINSSRVEHGRVKTVDSERRLRSMLQLLSAIGPQDMTRVLRAALAVRRDPTARYLGSPAFDRLAERHDDPPLDRWFGERAQSVLIRPMTVRMNGAEPEEVNLGSFGSNVGGAMETYDQLRNGFAPILDAFAATGPCELRTTVEALSVEDGRVTGVRVRRADGRVEERRYTAVVVAVPAHEAASLLKPHLPDIARDLRPVRYFPAAVVIAQYDRPIFPSAVRALLFPSGSPVSNAGAYGISDRHIVRYTFSGRASREHIGDDFDPEALLADAERRLASVIPISAGERRGFVAQRWERALCAYSSHHSRRLERVFAGVRRLAGLHLTGDYVRGGTIESCFRAAEECADAVAAELCASGVAA